MRKSIITFCLAMASTASLPAADFFNTGAPDNLFNIGLRAGVNTTNVTINKDVFDTWSSNAWGVGGNVGVVADINFRDYISVQPGFFFETRSSKYTYISRTSISTEGTEYLSQFGNIHAYNFTIPILGCVHFNLSDDIRWNVEFGPYFQIVLKNKVSGQINYPLYSASDALPQNYARTTPTKFDFGFKIGSSLKVLDHYLVGFHYEAGCLKPWDNGSLGGRRKGWVFSLGYDF